MDIFYIGFKITVRAWKLSVCCLQQKYGPTKAKRPFFLAKELLSIEKKLPICLLARDKINVEVVINCSQFPVILLRGGIAMLIQFQVTRQSFQEKFLSDMRLSLGNLGGNTASDE